jgi:putative tricarboxylic transport membrane protein
VFLYAVVGCIIGTLVGVLPASVRSRASAYCSRRPSAWTPPSAIVLLAGIYYGAMYGGSTTSILMRIPGEAASVMTASTVTR